MSTSRKRRKYSYSYLAEIRADYAEKLQIRNGPGCTTYLKNGVTN